MKEDFQVSFRHNPNNTKCGRPFRQGADQARAVGKVEWVILHGGLGKSPWFHGEVPTWMTVTPAASNSMYHPLTALLPTNPSVVQNQIT